MALPDEFDSLLDEEPSPARSGPARPAASALVPWALAQLRDDDAALIEEFHLDGRSMRELAALRATTERAIEGRLRRARERLRAGSFGSRTTRRCPCKCGRCTEMRHDRFTKPDR